MKLHYAILFFCILTTIFSVGTLFIAHDIFFATKTLRANTNDLPVRIVDIDQRLTALEFTGYELDAHVRNISLRFRVSEIESQVICETW
jgi:hypothetical protein